MAKETRTGVGRTTVIRENELKVCDLCGHLNLDTNPECFVCGWHGHFEQSPEIVHAAVELTVRRYGRLDMEHLTDTITYHQPIPLTFLDRFKRCCVRVWYWLCK